jgi:hypothetical protein
MAQDRHTTEVSTDTARAMAQKAVKQLQAEHYRALKLGINFLPVSKNAQPDNYDRTNIVQVCQYRDLAALHALQVQGFDFRSLNTESALLTAVGKGYIEIVTALLDYGADINGWNGTFLKSAVLNENMEIADLLIERGLSVKSLSAKERQAYDQYSLEQQVANHRTLQTLTEAFKAATWAGHVPEMIELWSKVPEPLHAKFDFQHVLTAATQLSLKQRKPKITLTK